MVIGETFAYGHIPKTGGDAVHAWLSLIGGLEVDPVGEARKHQFFEDRGVRKDLYVLSIRRLPSWALSYLHELSEHPASARSYGIPPGDTVRPEHAFRLRPDDYLRRHMAGGRTICKWLRMEYLFDDVVEFIGRHIRPVTPQLRERLAAVTTKPGRIYRHNIDSFFTPDQIAALYTKFPLWAAVEAQVYGGLLGKSHLAADPPASRAADLAPPAP